MTFISGTIHSHNCTTAELRLFTHQRFASDRVDRHIIPKIRTFNFELIRILTTAPFGGCDVAEFLEAAGAISKARDPGEQWHKAWQAAGERAEAIALEAAGSGDVFSAQRAHLRAANYFRASQYMTTPSRSSSSSSSSSSLVDGKRYSLPGLHYILTEPKRSNAAGKVPVLINTYRADSSQEEQYFCLPVAGVELGYAMLTFEGPGQGIEVVVSQVLDFLLTAAGKEERKDLQCLDLNRVTLAGASMGGYFALRGATDPRVAACVSIDPFYTGVANSRYLSNFQDRWELDMSRWMFRVHKPTEMFRRVMQFTLGENNGDKEDREKFLSRIKCPVLVSGAKQSLYFKPDDTTHKIYHELANVGPENKVV
ncbi:dipeptidyl aminopeptidase/acylaminoacyl peptidase [Diplogelasinospora grovesii]|uniref:Dipeptidyl aminopeptidase/acylaminoacyl peptidase n=1 Tax=Diplogelasinospora grovesii TaxID=303347 RepID=A0AAN6NMF9_9PEZI|nr:dipeptidyl aminopeptidase/acylaminoacyl peptidase [Diplogelasinospora grovesii]